MNERKVLVSEVCDGWLHMKRLRTKQSTYAKYSDIVKKHIQPAIGDLPISEISSSKMNEFIYDKLHFGRLDSQGPLSSKTVRDICTILKSIIRYAQSEYHLNHLASNAVLPKRVRTSLQILNEDEVKRLEQYLLSHLGEIRCTGMLLCLYTGLRLGEICALKWKDIDLKRETVHVGHTIQRIPLIGENAEKKTSVILDRPKSDASQRTIPLPHFITAILKEIYCQAFEDAFFLTNTLKYIEPRNYQYFFKRVLEKSGVRNVNFHILRHTFATRCVAAGFDTKSLSEILGHSDTAITLNYYVHSTLETKRKQMELVCRDVSLAIFLETGYDKIRVKTSGGAEG